LAACDAMLLQPLEIVTHSSSAAEIEAQGAVKSRFVELA
jgi:hypothetical protein